MSKLKLSDAELREAIAQLEAENGELQAQLVEVRREPDEAMADDKPLDDPAGPEKPEEQDEAPAPATDQAQTEGTDQAHDAGDEPDGPKEDPESDEDDSPDGSGEADSPEPDAGQDQAAHENADTAKDDSRSGPDPDEVDSDDGDDGALEADATGNQEAEQDPEPDESGDESGDRDGDDESDFGSDDLSSEREAEADDQAGPDADGGPGEDDNALDAASESEKGGEGDPDDSNGEPGGHVSQSKGEPEGQDAEDDEAGDAAVSGSLTGDEDATDDGEADGVGGAAAEAGVETSQASDDEGSPDAPGGRGAGHDDVPAFTQADLERVMRQFEEEAALIVEGGLKRANSFEALGQALHEPLLPNAPEIAAQTARDPVTDLPVQITVRRPRHDAYRDRAASVLAAEKSALDRVAGRIAIELDDIRAAVRIRKERFLDDGRLDRSRLAAAYKGDANVRYRDDRDDETSLCASLVLDLSGSMNGQRRDLFRATHVISGALTQLQMAHEVRGFDDSGGGFHFKAIDDPEPDLARIGGLLSVGGGGTTPSPALKLAATALLGREEGNKIAFMLTDGALDWGDQEPSAETLAAMRKKGVLTFGLFLGVPDPATQIALNRLYGATGGRRNWEAISSLDELPKKVAARIADILNSIE